METILENILLIVILIAVVGGAARYIYKTKKGGKKCIGCPYNDSCSAKSCAASCGCTEEE